LRFETLLAEISARFVNLPADQLDGQIKDAQKRICETLGFDRSSLAQIPAEGSDLIITHSWTAEGFQPSSRLSQRDLPWVVQRLLSGQRLCIARIDDLPEEAAKDKETLRRVGAKSSVSFPLSSGEKTIGALAFGTLRGEREWPDRLVERLGIAAQVFASALSRARVDKELQHAYHEIEELKHRLEKENAYLQAESDYLQDEIKGIGKYEQIIGDSESLRQLLWKLEQVAPTDSVVLITGESGTGKELVARAIHDRSRHKDRVLVKVDCAALPPTLIESELFGREKGAYTGALTRQIGRFETADGSTLFLDEIGELGVEAQAKLLR